MFPRLTSHSLLKKAGIPVSARSLPSLAFPRYCSGHTPKLQQVAEGEPTPSSWDKFTDRALSFLTFSGTFAAAGLGYMQYAYDLPEVHKYTKDMEERADAEGGFTDVNLLPLVKKYLELREYIDERYRYYADPSPNSFLPDFHPNQQVPRTLVLDLDELLVYSDWTRELGWKTFKRPGAEIFLQHMSQFFELVIFTDQNQTYAEPIVERLDPNHTLFNGRLYRDATQYKDGEHVRDLSKLNRQMCNIIYLGANPKAYSMQPENAIPVPAWKKDPSDRALLDLMPFLEEIARMGPALGDVRTVINHYVQMSVETEKDIPTLFRERKQAAQQEILKKKLSGGRPSFLRRGE